MGYYGGKFDLFITANGRMIEGVLECFITANYPF